jgi:hypothetical protein
MERALHDEEVDEIMSHHVALLQGVCTVASS